MQPIKKLSSAAGLCAGKGCALIRHLANFLSHSLPAYQSTDYLSPSSSVFSFLQLYLKPAVHISCSRSPFQVFLGRPLHLQPCSVHCSACLAMLSALLKLIFNISPTFNHVTHFYTLRIPFLVAFFQFLCGQAHRHTDRQTMLKIIPALLALLPHRSFQCSIA